MRRFLRHVLDDQRAHRYCRSAMRVRHARSTRFSLTAPLFAASTALSCGEVLALDDYRVPSGDSGHAGEDEPPLLPALPDSIDFATGESRIDVCRTCVAEKCDDLRQSCLASERCSDMLRCTGRCSDPNCIYRCKDSLPASPYFEDYFACAFSGAVESASRVTSRCFTECQAGGNWDCLGGFRWDRQLSPVLITVHLIDIIPVGASLAGATVATCGDGFSTPEPTGDWGCADEWVTLGPYGTADLDFTDNRPAVVVRDPVSGAGQRIYPRPATRSTGIDSAPMVLAGYSTSGLRFGAGTLPGFDPALGVLDVLQADCLATMAESDIQIEATDGGTVQRAYSVGLVELDPLREYGSRALFVGVPPAQAVRVQSSRAGGTPVSGKTALVAAGWPSVVFLYPMSLEDVGL